MNYAPIVLFVYNRIWHLKQTVESLLQNPLAAQSVLYIYSDAAKGSQDASNVAEVRQYIHQITGFKEIHIYESEKNLGLAPSVIHGVTEILNQHKKAIVMEDDLLCSTNFLDFMNDSLDLYAGQPHIFSISGYAQPVQIPQDFTDDVYLFPRASSWGWGTWLDKWQQADWEVQDFDGFVKDKVAQREFNQGGEDLTPMLVKQQRGLVSSWAVRWCYTHYKHQALSIYPRQSRIHNTGNDESGVHSRKTSKYDAQLSNNVYSLPAEPKQNPIISQNLQQLFKPSIIRRTINYFKFGI
jgi:hypothetical protein